MSKNTNIHFICVGPVIIEAPTMQLHCIWLQDTYSYTTTNAVCKCLMFFFKATLVWVDIWSRIGVNSCVCFTHHLGFYFKAVYRPINNISNLSYKFFFLKDQFLILKYLNPYIIYRIVVTQMAPKVVGFGAIFTHFTFYMNWRFIWTGGGSKKQFEYKSSNL